MCAKALAVASLWGVRSVTVITGSYQVQGSSTR